MFYSIFKFLENLNHEQKIFYFAIFSFFILLCSLYFGISSLVFFHSIASSFTSFGTFLFGFDPTYSITFTTVYMLIHTPLIPWEPDKKLTKLTTFLHHAMVLIFGITELVIRKNEMTYILIQTNEISNIFLTWYHWTKSILSGVCFAIVFFLSRVVWDTFYVFPNYILKVSLYLKFLAVPFYLVQYLWLYEIIKKFYYIVIKKSKSKKKEKED
ncbi:hypothetical protein M0811_02821 [Anaeramoeba ignava]|uniref:TLC domain-containing protein n=1 Tax=Anaeramoeba ignava TaxID=1746090 RepID=A0A9Q0R5V2_ANAIG|nr:hypothetical protein M0811_02821 [Anaeramoeba ignava]